MKKDRNEEGLKMTKREERFCRLIALGTTPQEAHLAAGYSPGSVASRPYMRLQKGEVRERIQSLMDNSIQSIVKNDIALAKIKVHKGKHILPDGNQIPPSLIEGAKSRIYDRCALGPVVRHSRNENLNVNANLTLTPEKEKELDDILSRYYRDREMAAGERS